MPASTTARTRGEPWERLRRYWDQHASGYDREMAFFERVLFGGGRQGACAQATGRVLEVAIGTGRNLAFYPPEVHLTGLEFSPAMQAIARERARELGRQIDLVLGDAQALEFADATFDTIVCTFSLCSIPDEARALAEMQRVLRPGGRLILLDHVAGEPSWVRALQWVLEQVMGPLSGGDHFLRRPITLLPSRGLAVEFSQRSKLGIVERVITRKSIDTQATEGGHRR
jgi:ubiquinone/menaquinone biosynthesis C-methylase UbiE